jgi:hypothetical protein
VQIFTGNSIAARGDMASRSMMLALTVDRPDPENRSFTHADPLAWTEANRGKIVRALYTLLIAGAVNRPINQEPKTRFKVWWRGAANEAAFLRATGPQIAPQYGALCRSTPVFFMQDDHDYFDNDEATDDIITFPPDQFMLNLARATRQLYYPEYLPDPERPLGLPGASAADRPPGVAEAFGTLRFGRTIFAARRRWPGRAQSLSTAQWRLGSRRA